MRIDTINLSLLLLVVLGLGFEVMKWRAHMLRPTIKPRAATHADWIAGTNSTPRASRPLAADTALPKVAVTSAVEAKRSTALPPLTGIPGLGNPSHIGSDGKAKDKKKKKKKKKPEAPKPVPPPTAPKVVAAAKPPVAMIPQGGLADEKAGENAKDNTKEEGVPAEAAAGGGSAAGRHRGSSERTLQEWRNYLLSKPNLSAVQALVSQYQAGEVSANDFYTLVQEMLASDRPETRSLAIYALSSTPSEKSFDYTAESEAKESTASPLKMQFDQSLNIYLKPANLPKLGEVLANDSQALAQTKALQKVQNALTPGSAEAQGADPRSMVVLIPSLEKLAAKANASALGSQAQNLANLIKSINN